MCPVHNKRGWWGKFASNSATHGPRTVQYIVSFRLPGPRKKYQIYNHAPRIASWTVVGFFSFHRNYPPSAMALLFHFQYWTSMLTTHPVKLRTAMIPSILLESSLVLQKAFREINRESSYIFRYFSRASAAIPQESILSAATTRCIAASNSQLTLGCFSCFEPFHLFWKGAASKLGRNLEEIKHAMLSLSLESPLYMAFAFDIAAFGEAKALQRCHRSGTFSRAEYIS